MSDELVIMFPDLGGEGSLGTFGHQLVERYGESEAVHLVPVINGVSDADDRNRIVTGISPLFEPAITTAGEGLVSALVAGYQHVLANYPDAAIVRLDTDEHPIALVPTLVQWAHECHGMAIGNLRVTPELLISGSADALFHAACPVLYGTASHRALPLSGVHGFQAFAPGACADVLEAALLMVERANRDGGPPLQWGLDGAMAMGAVAIGTPVYIANILATQPRQRPAEKVADQLNDFIRTVLAALDLYDFSEPL